ncbi:ABC transporter ATP-binding protein [Rubellimicrobium aerolatum]|uniref:ABC transporter ATP-binding protein n=1 Tax=Rubellimicrobium aerolatum TaxID=490979 RepID=A0ABW0S825_9RHOB|nr:ABC transporter ATP-binding protein [Rubellimicrobium aerolatum]MBP1804377.1 glycerol transport system ATP-binding protein [Rubellimicrobium aerolatum]
MTLELQGVAKAVGARVHIHPTNLVLRKGSLNVLLGPTLSGKTTLMRLMAGLDQPTAGRVLWEGRDVTGVRVQDRGVAMVYQQFINYPSMTVFDNIASPLRLQGLPRADIESRVRRAADLMRLTPYLSRKPLELSGGQQQRTALARALVKEAGLVLLDEPLANLDYKLREELRAEIPRLFEESGAVFVYATTEPEEALLLGGHTATLWEGRVTQFGPTAEVYRAPVDAVTARVFSNPPMNILDLRKDGDRLLFGAGEAAVPARLGTLPDGPYRAGFRAHHLGLDRPAGEALAFQATVLGAEITGSETFLHLDHTGARWVGLLPGVRPLAPGTPVAVWLDAAHLHLFDAGGRRIGPSPEPMAA